MKLKIPVILDDYYETADQDLRRKTIPQILGDCEYIIGEIAIGEWWDDYSSADVAALKRFRTMLRKNPSATVSYR